MKNGIVGMVVTAVGMAMAADPLSLPQYQQRFEVEFASEAEAKAAQCEMCPLPDDAKISFGTRWDDTNINDIPKGEMLKAAGAKGNFYLTGNGRDSVFAELATKLPAMGHALGNHTWTHPFVGMLSPNRFFRQIMETRIRIETEANHTINSYVGPYGWQWNNADPEQFKLFARILVDTGHILTGDNPLPKMEIDEKVWYPSHRFSANDKEPSEEQFKHNSAVQLAIAEKSPDSPRLTLGTHAWCDAKGNELQKKWITELCAGKNWAQQNDWEYGAYRYQYLNGTVRKVGTKGTTAIFEVTRFAPAALAADVPLSLKVLGKKDIIHLAHDKGMMVVTKIAEKELDGVTLEVKPNVEGNCAEVILRNGTKNAINNIYAVLYAPPVWKQHRFTVEAKTLNGGETFSHRFDLGERDRADYDEDAAFWATSADFSNGKEFERIWAKNETRGAGMGFAVPRDAVRVTPYEKRMIGEKSLIEASKVGAEWPNGEQLQQNANREGICWYVTGIAVHGNDKGKIQNGEHTRYFIWDFESKRDCDTELITTATGKAFYLNGTSGKLTDGKTKVHFKKGANRVIVSDTRVLGKYLPVIVLRANPEE